VEERGKQAILFLNRRGYNSEINCKNCGEVITCPRCSVSLTYHTGRDGGRLLCHLCGYTDRAPKRCPACNSDNISFIGYGTQKVEGDLSEYAPNMRVMRMDADTTAGKLAYDRMLEDFRSHKADILLGTQMVAKGHDFPDVTLVGVVLADTSLYVSDFRASERTFSLLTQVIGRAGRAGARGLAVIQTYSPKNEIIRLACEQDYDKFYEGEIAIRRELSYPPFCDMVSLTVVSDSDGEALSGAKRVSDSLIERIREECSDLPFTVFGPFEAQVYKLNDKYRMKMMVKCRLSARVRRIFHSLLTEFSTDKGLTLSVDFNPANM
jgi:primosomal protein N' (replication factor Y)